MSLSHIRSSQPPPVRYGIAVLLTVIAFLLSNLLWTATGDRSYVLLTAAVVFSAWMGGFGPGMLSAGLGLLLVDFLLIEPALKFAAAPADLIRFVVFTGVAFLISWLEERRNQTEQALRDVKDELEIILQGAADGITAEDAAGRTVFANQAAATLTGFASPRAMSENGGGSWQSNFEIFNDQGALIPHTALPRYRVFETGQSSALIYKMRFKNTGEERWIALRSAPIFDRSGRVRLAVSILRDVTTNRQATVERRRSEDRVRKVLDNLNAFVAVLTPNGSVIEVNRAALISAGLTTGEVLNQSFDRLPVWTYSVEVQQQVRDAIRQAAHGKTIRQDMQIRVEEHRFISVDFMIAPVFDSSGMVEYLVASGIDINERIRLTQELAGQSHRLEAILNSLPGVVYEVSRNPETGEQRLDFVSHYAEKMFGYPMEQWRTSPMMWHEIVTPDELESARQQLNQEQAAGEPGPLFFQGRTQDGRTLHLESYNIRILNANGDRVGTRGVVLDVTERRKREDEIRRLNLTIEKQRRRLDLMVTSVPGIVFESSPDENGDWRMDFISPHIEKILGYPPEDCQTTEFWMRVTHPEDRDVMVRTLVESAHEGVPPVMQFRCYARDGRMVYLEAHSGSIVDSQGSQIGVAGVMMDVTERKQIEESIVQYTDDLRRSNEELEQFAYVASHDLQEPLRMVASYLQLLEQRYVPVLDEDGKTFIGFAVDGATRMKTLINDLLMYSRVQRNRANFERVDMQQAFDQVVYNLQLHIEDLKATITHDPLPEITANEGHMIQLLQNMIGNALKFHSDIPPVIHIGVQRDQHTWRFFVRDNGIGIEPEFINRIFVIFQRLHSRDRYPGTGIGLAICKKIVENHGGEIRVESQPGSGATFYFTIPIEMKESLRSYAANAGRGDFTGRR